MTVSAGCRSATPNGVQRPEHPHRNAGRRARSRRAGGGARATIEGQGILDEIGGALAPVGAIVRAAHERWDGNGYPDALVGTEIPIEARIVAACDAFAAMVTDRPYHSALPVDVALARLADNAGTQFDPQLVEAVLRVVPAGSPVASPSRQYAVP